MDRLIHALAPAFAVRFAGQRLAESLDPIAARSLARPGKRSWLLRLFN